MKSHDYYISILPAEAGRFFVYAKESDGALSLPENWKKGLFLWHEESFFGTGLAVSTRKGVSGLEIDSWQLLTLLARESFNPLFSWSWSEEAEALIAAAPSLLESIDSGRWMPEFNDGGDSPFQWRLPAAVRQEFPDSFWEQMLFGEKAETVMKRWFHYALNGFLKTRKNSRKFAGQLELLENGPLSAGELTAFFDEIRWAEWTGMTENPLPFTMGLRLSEPEDDGEPWLLETVLRDKKEPDRLLPASALSDFPKRWRPFEKAIEQEEDRWLRLFPWLSRELDELSAWAFLTEASEKLLLLGVEILLPSWWEAMREASLAVKARVRQSGSSYRPSFVGLNAVLDFDWRLSMNGTEISEQEFASLVENQRRLVKIRGQWVKLDPKMIAHIQALMEQAKKEGLRMQDLLVQEAQEPISAEGELLDPRAFARVQIELNQSLKKMIRQLHDIQSIPEVPVPPEFRGQLRPYQQQGLNWLAFLRPYRFGAVLADDMGLGKTVQLISYLLHVRRSEQPEQPALIICPTSVLGNWQREMEQFAPDMRVLLHYGPHRARDAQFKQAISEADVVLTSYGLSHLDFDELYEVEWSTIALDEAQNIKNSETKQSRAIRKLKSGHHIALTGTPMENRLSELWSIFDFTNHGYLGAFGQFQKNFILPIEKDGDEKKIEELQRRIRPFLLRRTKKDPEVELNLPDKLEEKEYCPLTTEQAALYEQLVQDTFSEMEQLSPFERKGMVLQMLNKLKQLCNHPALYLKEEQPRRVMERSSKLAKLSQLAEAIMDSGEACLIFTQYLGMGEMIRGMLEKKFSIKVPFLNGSMPKSKRDEYVRRFQDGEFPFFLLSLKAGGTGLNLTAASHVIHYDRWWNPAVENQATDRAYRIGQTKFVHVHKFISTGTLEEKIDAMLEKKQSLNDEIIRSDQWITELSNNDLRSLLALTT